MTLFWTDDDDVTVRPRPLVLTKCDDAGPWLTWPLPRRRPHCNRPNGHDGDHVEYRRADADVVARWPQRPAVRHHPLSILSDGRGDAIDT